MSLLNEHSVSEIAESIYTGMIEHISMRDECKNMLVDGTTENTVRGQELYYEIEDALTRALESLEGEQNA